MLDLEEQTRSPGAELSLSLRITPPTFGLVKRVVVEGVAKLEHVSVGRAFWRVGDGIEDDGSIDRPETQTASAYAPIIVTVKTTGAGNIRALASLEPLSAERVLRWKIDSFVQSLDVGSDDALPFASLMIGAAVRRLKHEGKSTLEILELMRVAFDSEDRADEIAAEEAKKNKRANFKVIEGGGAGTTPPASALNVVLPAPASGAAQKEEKKP